MIIFSVDSSSVAGSAALLCDGEAVYECFAKEGLTHSETLLARCDEVFEKTGYKPSDVDCYAVTAGPGSFTGLRIGLNLVKGMAFANGTPCVPVSTFDALAYPAAMYGKDILCTLDARQKRVYCAAYHVVEGKPVQILTGQILPLKDLSDALMEAGICDPIVVGDAAKEAHEAVSGSVLCEDRMIDVHAAEVGKVAYGLYINGSYTTPDGLAPVYLQLSQAERERKKAEGILL
ncbi:MAG: tRNA (adenosine(37)-N6)-threonylcarbamoyltransferase complex dimerization subunit type 1 TsaB [Oscillospiraceae bacterium]|nr:tRNA (adenosine(37)-N6)-threonylcarbamoyltransferase complex dimerization subunit type 1 TsaB [Oscillospiraceae bacterium]